MNDIVKFIRNRARPGSGSGSGSDIEDLPKYLETSSSSTNQLHIPGLSDLESRRNAANDANQTTSKI